MPPLPAGWNATTRTPSSRAHAFAKGYAWLDATFVKPNAHDWDIAAADLILREAGGAVLDGHGRAPLYAGEVIRHGALVAGSGKLLTVLAGVIAGTEA